MHVIPFERKLRPIHISTRSGGILDIRNPDPSLILIEDIASALSKLCRFCGQCPLFYSVAEHSVQVSRMMADPALRLQALLHDASEAYMSDIVKGLKSAPELAGYRALEYNLQGIIYQRFGCPFEEADAVKEADHMLGDMEYEMLMKSSTLTLAALTPELARAHFLEEFKMVYPVSTHA